MSAIVPTSTSPAFYQIGPADVSKASAVFAATTVSEITQVTLARSIDQASTVTVTCRDATRALANSPQLAKGARLTLAGYSFTLCAVSRQTGTLTLTFEDTSINLLRQQTKVITIGPGVLSRTAFARRLVSSVPGLKYVGWPGAPKTLEALAVGSASDAGSGQPPEDYWAAMVRQSSEVNWRLFAIGNTIYQGPDSWLISASPTATVQSFTAAVDYIDVDFDEGKPQGDITIYCYADLWSAPQGSVINVLKKGPASGAWIVSGISRDLAHVATTITATQPQPALPEPAADSTATTATTTNANASAAASGGIGEKVVAFVTSALMTPYAEGGNGPGVYDCSGLTKAAYASAGITIPRVASDQYAAFTKVPQGQEQPGDICCFGNPVAHVGIYIGNNQMIDAPHTGSVVRYDPVTTFGDPPYVGAVRPS